MSNARSRQLAYFKDNIQTQDDQDEFDASRYYYNREDQIVAAPSGAGTMSSIPYTGSLNGTSNGVYGTHPATGFTTHPGRGLQIPQIAGHNSMTFAPSSDLLAMLSRGTSSGSAELPAASSNPNTDGDLTRHPVRIPHANLPVEMGRDARRAPFDMSEFPALAGRVQLPHSAPRDSLVDVSTLNLPSSDTLSIIERDHVTRADALTASDLNGLNPNALATEQQPPLTRANAHDYGQDTGSSFAMQSEDFPALPGSQLTAPDVFGREDCAITEHASTALLPAADAQGSTEANPIKFESDANIGTNKSAVLSGIARSSDADTEFLSNVPHNLQTDKSSVVAMPPVSPVIGVSSMPSSRGALHATSFDRMAENHSESFHHSASVPTSRAFGNVSDHVRTKLSQEISGHSDEGPIAGTPPAARETKLTGKSEAEGQTKYGLLGLLDVIRMTNADLNTLALGSDLTTLGLNLNSSECLYSTFASPWAEAPTTREPQFSLPLCYYMQPPPLKTSHLSKFQLETLFYIFYAMPKDVCVYLEFSSDTVPLRCYRRMQPRNCTIVSGNITKTSNYGSSVVPHLMGLAYQVINIYILISRLGNADFFQIYTLRAI